MNEKLISVIIPYYEANNTINRCLRSLASQSISKEKFVVIIVDDGSKNSLKNNLQEYDFDIKSFYHDSNKGLPAALNTALYNISTRYFVRLDADDYVHANFLEILLLKFELDPETFAVSVDYKLVDELENTISVQSSSEYPIGCGIAFRTEILRNIGYYNEKMLMAEEIEYRKRAETIGKISRIALPLYKYVKHLSNMTNDDKNYDRYKKKIPE